MRRNSLILICLFSLYAAACTSPGAKETQPAASPAPTKIPVSEKTSVDPEAMAGLSWWHREDMVTELKLDEEQQKKMDAHLEELLLHWGTNVRKRKGSQIRFVKAIRASDFEEARKIAEDYGQAEAFFSSGGLLLKAGVLAELRPEQLQLLLEKHPRILKSRWITSGKIKTKRQGK